MLFIFIAMAVTVPAAPSDQASSDGVNFKCEITGGGDNGFQIVYRNPGKIPKSCTASCKVTKSKGGTQELTDTVYVRADETGWTEFASKTGVSGAPLKDPEMGPASCVDKK